MPVSWLLFFGIAVRNCGRGSGGQVDGVGVIREIRWLPSGWIIILLIKCNNDDTGKVLKIPRNCLLITNIRIRQEIHGA